MKKFWKNLLIVLFVGGLIFALSYIFNSNSKKEETYYTEQPEKRSIGKEIVATGKIIPEEEIEIKPNISGIIDRVLVEEGSKVQQGELIASVRVVPQVSDLNNAQQSLRSAQITLNNEKRSFNRQKTLFDQGVISRAEYEQAETSYQMAKQSVSQAQKQIQIIRTGVAPGLENVATTQIRATATGVVLQLPIERGDQVIEANSFNPGTTVAIIADIQKMIFEGQVDEAEAGKLSVGMPIKITIGALPDEELSGTLTFISPQGTEVNGAVQFDIKANVLLNAKSSNIIRAGYSANAIIELDKQKKVLTIKESLLQYDKDNKAFVEVETGEGEFKKRYVVLGNSDNEYIEIKDSLTTQDKIKVWNPTEEEKEEDPKE